MPKFNTKKWIEVHDQSGGIYNNNKKRRFKISVVYILLLKELLMLQIQITMDMIKN